MMWVKRLCLHPW